MDIKPFLKIKKARTKEGKVSYNNNGPTWREEWRDTASR